MTISELTPSDIGRWVVYRAADGFSEEGRIKRIGPEVVWVVYHCNGQWDRYDKFDAAATSPKDLEFK